MLLLLVITIGSLTFASIRSTIGKNRETELNRLGRIEQLMTSSQFPLTPSVLENMKLLSGADFRLHDLDGKVVATTKIAPEPPDDFLLPVVDSGSESVPQTIEVNDESFYHTAVTGLRSPGRQAAPGILHIFVPRQTERSVWISASRTPMTIAIIALPLALLLSLALANQVTRPLSTLNLQVQRIAEGDLQPIPATPRNDEILDLNQSINDMAVKLQDHQIQLRKNERLSTMVQLGNSIAHHLRNSATGCKMAVQLLANDQKTAESENYQVAIRQLELIDNFIKKFLFFSQGSHAEREAEPNALDLREVLDNVVYLLGPSADHLKVRLEVDAKCDASTIEMDSEDAQQMMMNLISNAIRAASEHSASSPSNQHGLVKVELVVEDGRFEFTVSDNGSGPPAELANSIFDPFVTGSKEGTGLGLSLVREISHRVSGSVDWSRESGMTVFRFAAETNRKGK